jgi:hypothetical protein
MQVRSADAAEIDHLARLWHDGWHQTHASLVPQELTRLRTSESFRERLQAALPNVHVAGPLGRASASTSSKAMSCLSFSCRPRHTVRASPRR